MTRDEPAAELLTPHLRTFDSPRLKGPARELVRAASAVFVSSASIWETSIKVSLGKLRVDPAALADEIEAGGFLELPVSARHAALVASLRKLQQDPFHRLLIAQAISDPLILLTADETLLACGQIVQMV